MTSFWDAHDPTQKIDPMHAAQVLGYVVNAIGTDPTAGTGTAAATSAIPMSTPQDATSTTDTTSTTSTGDTSSPVADVPAITHGFGGADNHPGVDLPIPVGTPVLAAVSGKVTSAGDTDPGGYGNMVEVTTTDGIVTRYAHLSGIQAKVGDTIKAGTQIGVSGGEAGAAGSGNATGPHLHFEVDVNGQPVDPSSYLATGPKILGVAPADLTTAPKVPGATPVNVTTSQANDPVSDLTVNNPDQAKTATTPTVATGADGDPNAVDAFLAAIRTHESGGDYTIRNQSGQSNASGAYQFLGSTWKGLGGTTASAAEAPPAEQDAIARNYAVQLFNEFHSWRLAAIAWFGGPGIAQQAAAGKDPGSPEGQGSYLAYGNTIASMMGNSGG